MPGELRSAIPAMPGIGQSPSGLDSAIIHGAGIPTVICGPGGAGAHARRSVGRPASVERCAEVLIAVASEFCA